jgi:mannose-1-phosphate guanylyltransferase/mannose-6-phosphate isomerase
MFPKQFVQVTKHPDFFSQTISRITDKNIYAPATIISNENFLHLINDRLQKIKYNPGSILLEPSQKNTAPAIYLACLDLLKQSVDENEVILVMPSDHLILDNVEFTKNMQKARAIAKTGKIVAFGIFPSYPASGYGYIKIAKEQKNDYCDVERFVEKPETELAKKFLLEGGYYWNSGISMVSIKTYMRNFEKYLSGSVEYLRASYANAVVFNNGLRLEAENFNKSQDISVDYGIMEKTEEEIALIPMYVGWSDIGSWGSLYDILPKDGDSNLCVGEVVSHNASGCFIGSEGQTIGVCDVSDLIIISTRDAVLVCNKNTTENVKKIVTQLKSRKSKSATEKQISYRPWGYYEELHGNDHSGCKLKKITVKPGQKLSLQFHNHRSEHWIVLKGTATVEVDGQTNDFYPNQHVFIPQKSTHRLSNNTDSDIEIIEVQIGSYLGEDDITRLADSYGRSS